MCPTVSAAGLRLKAELFVLIRRHILHCSINPECSDGGKCHSSGRPHIRVFPSPAADPSQGSRTRLARLAMSLQ